MTRLEKILRKNGVHPEREETFGEALTAFLVLIAAVVILAVLIEIFSRTN